MKRLLLVLMMILSNVLFGQLFEFQMESVKYRQNKGGYFTEWSLKEGTSVKVTLNTAQSRITVNTYPQETTYKIIESKPLQEIDDSLLVDYYCVDSKGKKCTITIVLSTTQNITMINLKYNNWDYIYTGYLLN